MSRRFKHRKKKHGLRPPLSFLDKCIYVLGLFLSLLATLAFIFGSLALTDYIAFQDEAVVASFSHASFLLVLPFLLYLEITGLVFCCSGLEGKTPIFGNRKVQYGQAPWAKDCFPLFDPRRKTLNVPPSRIRFRRQMLKIWLIGLLLCAMIAPFGLFSRDCLTRDNSIITYNLVNVPSSHPYTTQDYSRLTIQAKHVTGFRTSDYWKYEIKIQMTDGESFTFTHRNFERREPGSQVRCLKKMLSIKALFRPEETTIIGAEELDKVVDDLKLHGEEIDLLYELFREP